MKSYAALIAGSKVVDVIVGDYIFAKENMGGNWVDCTENGDIVIGIGFTYDPATDTFTPPPTPEADDDAL